MTRGAKALVSTDLEASSDRSGSRDRSTAVGVGVGVGGRGGHVAWGRRRNTDLIQAERDRLLDSGVTRAEAGLPEAGYYTFAVLDDASMKDAIVMDQRFFGLDRFDNHVRVNLLCPGWPQP
ncbi:hypothetical protein ACFTXM_00635 [Streptomyces sp. NPDC056930]|uniref:hypothetical protein n=1 Tax=Streptomyces sp. NPDC056930 TaxID=3345967 RepID=UPI00363791CC